MKFVNTHIKKMRWNVVYADMLRSMHVCISYTHLDGIHLTRFIQCRSVILVGGKTKHFSIFSYYCNNTFLILYSPIAFLFYHGSFYHKTKFPEFHTWENYIVIEVLATFKIFSCYRNISGRV